MIPVSTSGRLVCGASPGFSDLATWGGVPKKCALMIEGTSTMWWLDETNVPGPVGRERPVLPGRSLVVAGWILERDV